MALERVDSADLAADMIVNPNRYTSAYRKGASGYYFLINNLFYGKFIKIWIG
jgi:hypothetical protein